MSDRANVVARASAAWRDTLTVPQGTPVFDSQGTWKLTEREGQQLFSVCVEGKGVVRIASWNSDYSRGLIETSQQGYGQRPVDPMEFPVDELLWMQLLARHEGVLLHACAAVDSEGNGHLFVGQSGAGKSTLARLLQGRGFEVLSDERPAVRLEGGLPRVYGTPWHGDARIFSTRSARLTSIAVLKHAPRNRLSPLGPGAAAAWLLATAFVPFYDRAAMERVLATVEALVAQVPTHEFHFTPDEGAVDFLVKQAWSHHA